MNYKCPYCLYPFTGDQVIEVIQGKGITRHICPNPELIDPNSDVKICGKKLPLNFMQSETVIIALTGAQGVGKTYYYLALIDQLYNNKHLHQIGIHGQPTGSNDENRELFAFIAKYRNNEIILPTTDKNSALTSVIELTITNGRTTKNVYLSFFDNPGERFNDIEYMIENFSNVYTADGLLFLIEPLQIEKLYKSLIKYNPYLKDEDVTDDLFAVLNNIVKLLKNVNGINVNKLQGNTDGLSQKGGKWEKIKSQITGISSKKIKTPLAIAISKFDQLSKCINVTIPFDDTQFEYMCINNDGFNDDIVNIISSEIEEVVTGPPDGEIAIKNLLSASMRDYAYFGFRSIDVNEDGHPMKINAQGVLLPLIWILKKLELY